jgi:chromosome segregation ATPase
MNRGSRIIAIGGEGETPTPDDIATAEPLELSDEAEDVWEVEEAAAPRSFEWVVPALAIAAIIGWTAFFAWTMRTALFGPATAVQWVDWIGRWSPPVLLICAAWLLVMRNSLREASRFGDAGRALAEESARLEVRLKTVNQELSLAREFIASQSRDLESLGRVAVDRISQNADRLQTLIRDNGAQVDAIGNVSTAALDNMERLRSQLPVIASSAKDVTNNIANAGRTAHSQLQEMVSGFKRLNEFGQASERQVSTLRSQVGDVMEEFNRQAEQLDSITAQRFAALAERSAEFRARLDSQEVEALASVRSRAATLADELEQTRHQLDGHEAESLTSLRARLTAIRDESGSITRAMREAEESALAGWRAQLARMDEELREALGGIEKIDEQVVQAARNRLTAFVEEAQRLDANTIERNRQFAAEVERRQVEAEEREAATLASMHERLEWIDHEIAERREGHARQTAAIAAHGEAVAHRLEELQTRISEVAAHGNAAEASLAASLGTLAAQLLASREALAGTDVRIAELTDSSVRLLELIQASVEHSRDALPAALSTGESRLGVMETRIFALKDAVEQANGQGESLSNHVIATTEGIDTARSEFDRLHEQFSARSSEHTQALGALHQSLASLGEESRELAERARNELASALSQLSAAARDAMAGLEHGSATTISEIAAKLGKESGTAIDKAMRTHAAEAAGKLEQAATHAAGVSREAAIQLRDQLAKVNELAGNLETRVAHARQRAEEQVDNDFSRRVALITESLNSNSIDIAKALSVDVADTAWSAYLKGDRGIFTRRAVSLIDSGEARAISQLYESDQDFRSHVSRYIHDFEAMLRQMLSTRDGHALGVTLLSSDMGKLYVALAQAIERLRN